MAERGMSPLLRITLVGGACLCVGAVLLWLLHGSALWLIPVGLVSLVLGMLGALRDDDVQPLE